MRAYSYRYAGLSLLILGTLFVLGCGSQSSGPTARQVEQVIAGASKQYGVPGMAAAVITPDRIVSASTGVHKLGEATVIGRNDLFHLGSDVKSMTAMLAAHEVESGKLQWTATLAEIFPEFVASMQPAYQSVTIQDLLDHRAAILPFLDQASLGTIPPLTGDALQQRYQFTGWVLQQTPTGVPGQDFAYSNGGYVVAGAVIEKIAGQPYETLLQQFLFTPLNLHVKYNWPGYQDPNQPWGHLLVNGALTPNDPNAPQNEIPAFITPAGNVSVSVEDFARYAQVHLQGLLGNATLLSKSSYTTLHTPVGQYGLGWAAGADASGVPLTFHEGSAGTFDAWIVIQPAKKRAIVLLSNADSTAIESGDAGTALQLLDLAQ